jgi:hypothetical protein
VTKKERIIKSPPSTESQGGFSSQQPYIAPAIFLLPEISPESGVYQHVNENTGGELSS